MTMTKLNVTAYALAAGSVAFVAGSICALLIAVNAVGFMAFIGYVTHIDLSSLARHITWTSYLAGIAFWTLATATAAGAFASAYNRFGGSIAGKGPADERVTITRQRDFDRTHR